MPWLQDTLPAPLRPSPSWPCRLTASHRGPPRLSASLAEADAVSVTPKKKKILLSWQPLRRKPIWQVGSDVQKLNLFMHSFCIGSKLFKEKPLKDLKNARSTRRRTELEIALGLKRLFFVFFKLCGTSSRCTPKKKQFYHWQAFFVSERKGEQTKSHHRALWWQRSIKIFGSVAWEGTGPT